jgi:hypothetical protein
VLRLASEPQVLEVQDLPGDAGVQLPLQALEVTLRVDPRQRLQVGQPFEISIVQQAAGAAGERLPDAAALLEHPDFRVYPGQHRTSSRLTRNGQLLQGQRIDSLTLVPLRDGELRLPSITLPWWDVTHGREAQAGWPDMRLRVWPAPAGDEAQPVVAQGGTAAGMAYMLAMPGILLAFMAGWWLRGRYRPVSASVAGQSPRRGGWRFALRPAFVRAWNRRPLRNHRRPTAGGRLGRPEAVAGRVAADLSRRMASATGRVAAQLPGPLARWRGRARLRKLIETATDVRQLHRYLLAWGREVLDLPARATLQELRLAIAEACPQPEGARISHLLAELDASLYGNGQPLNLAAWKKTLLDQLVTAGARPASRAVTSRRQQGLPALNPG